MQGEDKCPHVGGMASQLQDAKDAGELYHFEHLAELGDTCHGPEVFLGTLVLQVTVSLKQYLHKERQDRHKVQWSVLPKNCLGLHKVVKRRIYSTVKGAMEMIPTHSMYILP